MKKVLLLAALLVLAGCKDYGRCLASHEEEYTYFVPILIGFSNNIPTYMYLPQQGIQTVCDQYEFPEGKPGT